MKPIYKNGHVVAICPNCGGIPTTFEVESKGKNFGNIIIGKPHKYNEYDYKRTLYLLMRCAVCHRGGIAKIHDNDVVIDGILEEFFPLAIENTPIPNDVPHGVVAEFREAELCTSVSAWRASSALFRSALEKILKENGYTKGTLKNKIDEASRDGIITEARRKRAHDDIRVLGNDVLHDKWREIDDLEVELAHHYVQRILEDFYDDRQSVEKILIEKKRMSKGSETENDKNLQSENINEEDA